MVHFDKITADIAVELLEIEAAHCTTCTIVVNARLPGLAVALIVCGVHIVSAAFLKYFTFGIGFRYYDREFFFVFGSVQ